MTVNMPMPLGIMARIDANNKSFEILESVVK